MMSMQTDFKAFAHQLRFVHGHSQFDAEQWKKIALSFMTGYSNRLGDFPNTYIGHIKGIITLPVGYIKLSCADISKGVFATEKLNGDICLSSVALILNSIIHCHIEDAVGSALSQALRKTSEQYKVQITCTEVVPVKGSVGRHCHENDVDSHYGQPGMKTMKRSDEHE